MRAGSCPACRAETPLWRRRRTLVRSCRPSRSLAGRPTSRVASAGFMLFFKSIAQLCAHSSFTTTRKSRCLGRCGDGDDDNVDGASASSSVLQDVLVPPPPSSIVIFIVVVVSVPGTVDKAKAANGGGRCTGGTTFPWPNGRQTRPCHHHRRPLRPLR
jgi:hypothetical protein